MIIHIGLNQDIESDQSQVKTFSGRNFIALK